jgi:LmbE family N-acetylglucosaminyl deacetylase
VVRDMPVAVLFGAHADDIELGAGGTCAKLCAAGFDVRIVVATDDRNASIASIRRNEARAAASLLGIPSDGVHFLGLTDGYFRCDRDSVTQVRTLFSELDICPDVIFTHTEADSHQDHIELTRIAKAAFRRVAIFKYRVSNSAISSHFRPCISSEIGPFAGLKSAALRRHKSQIILGRVGRSKASVEHIEAFELEIQDGAANFSEILDCVNDAPFSRFWMPWCAVGGITVIAASQLHRPQSEIRIVSRAPSELQLVTRLQSELSARIVMQRPMSFTVDEAKATNLDELQSGVSLILGGPAVNPVAQPFLDRVGQTRFRVDFASIECSGHPIFDTHTGRLFKPSFAASRGTDLDLTRDYGLLTIARVKNGHPGGEESLVIAAMGVHAAGPAATFSCNSQPEYLACIVDSSRRVRDGTASWAQSLVPCDGAGVPIVSEIQCHTNDQQAPQSQPTWPAASKRLPKAS